MTENKIKPTEFTLSKKLKYPIEGVDYAMKEAMVSHTFSIEEGGKLPSRKELRSYWEDIKLKLEDGLSEDAPDWLMGDPKEDDK